jgi:predicted amidohydrolase YtcJ
MNGQTPSLAKFRLGHIVATPNALTRLAQDGILAAIQRHQAGYWGDMPEEDRQENELSLQQGFRLLSAYSSAQGVKFWIITEADRSSTCVLLPEDY